jgi:hypothetical protein
LVASKPAWAAEAAGQAAGAGAGKIMVLMRGTMRLSARSSKRGLLDRDAPKRHGEALLQE